MLTLEAIQAAEGLRGESRFRRTPLHYPTSLNARMPGEADIHLKMELLQRTGSFKVRGATAKVLALGPAERDRGILAASAGNHAQGVALASSSIGVQARIVMPEYAPLTKQEATHRYGAEIILHGQSYDDAHAHARELEAECGATFVHAFDDEQVMAGQGTMGLEILEDLPDLASVVCPVGGGGLISGMAVAIKSARPRVRVIGVQAEGAASAVTSFRAGERMESGPTCTIADGIKVAQVGERCFDVIRHFVDEMVVVDDASICRAMLMLDEHAHVSAEPAGAAPVAAVLSGRVSLPAGPAVLIVSGGNIDTFQKNRYIRRALQEEDRHLRIGIRLADRRGSKPREMAALFALLAEHDLNVLDVAFRRDAFGVPLGWVQVELLLETRGRAHGLAVRDAVQAAGFSSNGA